MSPNKNKRKGSDWEHLLVELLNQNVKDSTVKRIPGSGAIGTIINEPILQSDVKAVFKGFNKPFKIECKTGYGGNTQLTLKKEWIDKVMEEAKNNYAYPALACKFSGARKSNGVQYFIVLDLDTFYEILNYVGKLSE